MKSKTVQKIQEKMRNDPWWIRLRRWLVVEIHIIRSIGILRYLRKDL